jgi:hypothetical protein
LLWFHISRRAEGVTRRVAHISLMQNWFEELKAKVPATN